MALDDIGVGVEGASIGDDASNAAPFEMQPFDARVELEDDAASTQKLGQCDRKFMAVAGLVIGQMQAACELGGRRTQGRLDG